MVRSRRANPLITVGGLATHERPTAAFEGDAFRNGLALRAEVEGTWGGTPPEPERSYDLKYLKKALALVEK